MTMNGATVWVQIQDACDRKPWSALSHCAGSIPKYVRVNSIARIQEQEFVGQPGVAFVER
jgi:hypothetical protein